jgi:hypothetical protein
MLVSSSFAVALGLAASVPALDAVQQVERRLLENAARLARLSAEIEADEGRVAELPLVTDALERLALAGAAPCAIQTADERQTIATLDATQADAYLTLALRDAADRALAAMAERLRERYADLSAIAERLVEKRRDEVRAREERATLLSERARLRSELTSFQERG